MKLTCLGISLMTLTVTLGAAANEKAASTEISDAKFTYSPAHGLGPEEGIMRRDPSNIIKDGDLYYVWYTKGRQYSGYNATIYYATSPDGKSWTEKGEALARGGEGAWDEQSVFTPNILVAEDRYWLFYTAVPKPFVNDGNQVTETAIGIAVADSADGPWEKLDSNPILEASDDRTKFDSMRVDDAVLVVHNGRYHLYFKGRQWNNTPGNTKMGVAIADAPGGPYIKHPGNPVIPAGHEVMAWPYGEGIMVLINIGPEAWRESLHYSKDGLNFSRIMNTGPVPWAAGFYRPEAFTDSGRGEMPEWGIQIVHTSGLPHLGRVECQWPDISTDHFGNNQP